MLEALKEYVADFLRRRFPDREVPVSAYARVRVEETDSLSCDTVLVVEVPLGYSSRRLAFCACPEGANNKAAAALAAVSVGGSRALHVNGIRKIPGIASPASEAYRVKVAASDGTVFELDYEEGRVLTANTLRVLQNPARVG